MGNAHKYKLSGSLNKSLNRLRIRLTAAAMAAAMLSIVFSGCGDKSTLDPDDPVSLTIWHYYNGAQKNAFDTLVSEFNSTVGKEKGIYVQGINQGSVSDLETAVKDSLEGKVGSDEMPDIFSSYADTAYEFEQAGALANLSDYMSDADLSVYVDSYVEEGRIAGDGSLRIFPVAKSSEMMIINKTDWDMFAQATGASLDDLKYIEGVVATAKAYYEWTDAQTPDVANDGKAFYGRDSMANYFCIGMMQLGNEIFQVQDGEVSLNTEKDSLKRLWDCYYVPMIKGYFAAYGSFRSDDVKTGELIAYTGSTTSAMYFPDVVELDDRRYEIDYAVMSAPIFEGGEKYAVQQGAGMVVCKSDERREAAAVEFMKWFTQAEHNLAFCGDSGYLPVMNEAYDRELLDKVFESRGIETSGKTYDGIIQMFDEIDNVTLYTNKSFRNGSDARKVLEYNLSDKAAKDRELIKSQLEQGVSLDEACEPYLTNEAFEQWYQSFCNALEDSIR